MQDAVYSGELIELAPYTLERCLRFFENYVTDPAMTAESYTFCREQVLRYHQKLMDDRSRRVFAVCRAGECIGEVSLKEVDLGAGCATLSIALCSEEVRGRGFGSEAERLILCHAFHKMRLKTVFADAARTNRRSQHVLRKMGFRLSHQTGAFLYYRLDREDFIAS